jgi:outer membrane protein assembly factor BamD
MARERQAGALALIALAVALAAPACGGTRDEIPPGTVEPDKLLFDRGTAALGEREWLTAREYFRQIWDGYPQSPFRADAKLGLGDTFLGPGGEADAVLGIAEFQEFLAFFPTHPRADYAQFRLAMAHHGQMAAPQRDQTETREAIRELEVFFERYPNSALIGEARMRYREAKDRLSESEYRVGLYYYRVRWYPGAIERFRSVLANDPEFTNRDAVYFHLGESLRMEKRPAEAFVYYERLIAEFEQSQYLEDAQQRVVELRPLVPAAGTEVRRPE